MALGFLQVGFRAQHHTVADWLTSCAGRRLVEVCWSLEQATEANPFEDMG